MTDLFWFSSLNTVLIKQFILKFTNNVQVQNAVIWQLTATT